MGKLTLLIVAAALVGGSMLKLGMHLIAGDTAGDRSETQADLLARQIAESGQSLVLAAMVGEEGFQDPGISGREYDGGAFTVIVDTLSADRQAITVTVEGRYGGAVHSIQSTYAFDPMEYPGPIWLDVPYATAEIPDAAQVSGPPTGNPARLDSRKFTDLNLDRYVSGPAMQNALGAGMAAAGSALSVPNAPDWAPNGPLLEDLSRQNDIDGGEDLYQAALASMGTGDVTYRTDQTVGGSQTWGGQDRVTRVAGDLTVTGRLTGSGALLVEGALRVPRGARMTWNGIVIVRDERPLLPVALDGDADISGGLVVVQDALPPGGHLDLTVMRDPNGMGDAVGSRAGSAWPVVSPVDYAWYEHTHEFDLKPLAAPRGRRVVFAENGAGRHEAETRFWESVRAAGSEPVYLEFQNPENHGFARYSLALTSERDSVVGMVRGGFDQFAARGAAHRSQTFDASDLRTFVLNVRSLRALQDRFDGQGACTGGVWPFCIGRDWNRADALSVRLVRARDGRALYDAAVYWHMRGDELAQHQADEAAWVSSLQSGTGFGTHLTMGPQASVTYRLRDIARLAEKLGFDGNEVRLVETTNEHATPSEMRTAETATAALLAGSRPGQAPVCSSPDTRVLMCDRNGRKSKMVRCGDVRNHLAHGCRLGSCAATPIQPVGTTAVCHRSGSGQTTMFLSSRDLPAHLAHGDRTGPCTSGSGGDDDDDDDDD
ncbi:MAG TPA: hypothetical protein VF576_12290 [Rubricoccaceae bacterium]